MNDTPGKAMSSLTVAEKRHHKPAGCVGVIFHLFDWNRKLAKKKRSLNKLLPAVQPKLVSKKFGNERLPMAKLLLIADENRGGFPNSKKPETDRTDSKFPSMDAERNRGMRAPGVVARLMGLDSMPSRDVSKPKSPPLFGSQRNLSEINSFDQDPCFENQPRIVDYQSKPTEFYLSNQDLNSEKKPTKLELVSGRAELRPQKLQKTGFCERRAVTRFQAEALPFKRVISRSRKHHPKLASPVKSPRVMSGRNSAWLMEAATKILEPGLQATNRSKCALTYSASSQLSEKEHVHPKEMPVLLMQCRPTEASKQPNYQNPVRSLKGQSLCKSLDNLLDVVGFKSKIEEQEHECGAAASTFSSSSAQESAMSKLKSPASSLEQERDSETPVLVQDKDTGKSVIAKNQERTISLAVQAKSNVQRKTQILQDRKLQKDLDQCSSSQQGKPQGQCQKVEQKENNQRQDLISTKDKLSQKPKPCNQQSRRDPSIVASFQAENQGGPASKGRLVSNKNLNDTIRSRTSTKVLGNKETQKDIDSSSSRLRTLPQRKRPVSCNSQIENTGTTKSAFFNGRNERNVVINGKGTGLNPYSANRNGVKSLSRKQGCSKNTEQDSMSRSKEMDIVSFTFTSPMRPGSKSSSPVERRRTSLHGDSCGGGQQKKTTLDPKNGRSPSPGSRTLDGDTLSELLEQKLRELTCLDRDESAARILPKECPSGRSTASLLQELLSALMADRPVFQEHNANLALGFSPEDSFSCNSPARSECSSTHSQTFAIDRKLQAEVFSNKCTPVRNCLRAEKKVGVSIGFPLASDSDHPSPVSILEASFSNDSCISSQSLDGNSVDKLHLSPAYCSDKPQSLHADTDLSDSATSANAGKLKSEKITRTNINIPKTQAIYPARIGLTGSELDYVKEVISNAELLFENVALYDVDSMGSSIVDPLLFDKLETLADALWRSPKSGLGFVETKNGYQFRKFLFDCMIECLDLKYSRYCKAGFKAWAKLPLSVCRKRLSREVYEEIGRWRSFAGKVVDEMVEREMSSLLGKWTDFEIEAFETGVKIERDILQMLVDETVIDLL